MVTAEKMNRMIETVRSKYDALDDMKTQTDLDRNLDIDFDEHFQYQNLQAQAHASDILSPEAALIVYNALGEVGSEKNGGWAAGTDFPTKMVVTQLMSELLERKVKARS